jgi:transposase-like protein
LALPMTMNAADIRDISRTLGISPNTVLSLIKVAALEVPEPARLKRIKSLEMDKFWLFTGKKADQGWT